MFFVIDKPGFQHVLSVVRDDRTKESKGLRGPFLRLEAKEDYVKVDGLTMSGTFAATVYEPGVLFLKVTLFRRLLRTIKGQKFLSIQVTADELVMDRIRMPLESNEMLLYADPDRAPAVHPSATLATSEADQEPKRESSKTEYCPSWLQWNEPNSGSGTRSDPRLPLDAEITEQTRPAPQHQTAAEGRQVGVTPEEAEAAKSKRDAFDAILEGCRQEIMALSRAPGAQAVLAETQPQPLPPPPKPEPEPQAPAPTPVSAAQRLRRLVAAHKNVTRLVVCLGAIALHAWTVRLFFEHWGKSWAIISLFLPPLSEIVAIGACPWWGAWYYALAIVALFVGYCVYCNGEGEPEPHWLVGVAFMVFFCSFIGFYSNLSDRMEKRERDARQQKDVEETANDICSLLLSDDNDPAEITKTVAEKDRLRGWIEENDDTEVKRRVDAFLRVCMLGGDDVGKFLYDANGWDSQFTPSAETQDALSSLPKDLQDLFGNLRDDIQQIRQDYGGKSPKAVAEKYRLDREKRWAVRRERYSDIFKIAMPSMDELRRRSDSSGK